MAGASIRIRNALATPDATVSSSHPHLFMTVAGASPTVSDLRTLYGSGGAANTDYQNFVNAWCYSVANGGMYDFTWFQANFGGSSGLDQVGDAAEAYAYILALDPVPGVSLRDATVAGLTTIFQQYVDYLIAHLTVDSGQALTHLGLIYDWGYNYLTAGERSSIVSMINAYGDSSPDNSFGASNYSPTGHSSTAAKGVIGHQSMGYVFGTDSVTLTVNAATRRSRRTARISGSVTATQDHANLIAGTTGGYCEGLEYEFGGNKISVGFVDVCNQEFYRCYANDASVWAAGTNKVHEYAPNWWAHMMLPYRVSSGGVNYMFVKSPNCSDRATGLVGVGDPDDTGWYMAANKLASHFYVSTNPTQAQLGQWAAETFWRSSGKITAGQSASFIRWGLWINLILRGLATAASPSALGLPKTILMTHGAIHSRNTWVVDGTGTFVRFVAEPYKWNITHIPHGAQGCFSIHRRGPILVHPGNGSHTEILESGWGGNVVLFVDPTEDGSAYGDNTFDKGGSRRNFGSTSFESTTDFAPGATSDIGGLKASTGRWSLDDGSAQHHFTAAKVDLKRAYNTSANNDGINRLKCKTNTRHFIHFPCVTPGSDPDYTLIYDITESTGSPVEQRWKFYPASPPDGSRSLTVTGATSNPTDVQRPAGTGRTTQRWLGVGGTMYGTIDYSGFTSGSPSNVTTGLTGRGYLSVLAPSSYQIIERGGPNGSNQYGQSDSWEQEDPLGGVDSGATKAIATSTLFECGWHYEIQPQTQAAVMNFAVVIEAAEQSATGPTTCTRVSGTSCIGIRIDAATGNRKMVILRETEGTLTGCTIRFTAAGTYDVLIPDWTPSAAITVMKGGNLGTITNIYNGSTAAYAADANGYGWIRVVVTTGANTTANDLTLS